MKQNTYAYKIKYINLKICFNLIQCILSESLIRKVLSGGICVLLLDKTCFSLGCFKVKAQAGRIAQWVEALATKYNDLYSIPGTHIL